METFIWTIVIVFIINVVVVRAKVGCKREPLTSGDFVAVGLFNGVCIVWGLVLVLR